MNQLQQLLIVLGALALLPTVVKLLWKIYLFPLSGFSGPDGQRATLEPALAFMRGASCFSLLLGQSGTG